MKTKNLVILATLIKLATATPFDNPADNGGKWITQLDQGSTTGEPLNIVISGDSDPLVFKVDDETPGGFFTYWDSLQFMQEFAGIHLGGDQLANVGDGLVSQQGILRYNYNDRNGGTLYESQNGGNHIRYWNQSSTNAMFIAASAEKSKAEGHLVIPDGYNLGRNWIAGNATGSSIENPTNKTSKSGQTTGYWTLNGDSNTNQSWVYETEVTFQSGLIPNGNENINHVNEVSVNGSAQDGLVAIFKVSIKTRGADASGSSNSNHSYEPTLTLTTFLILLATLLVI